MSCSLVSYSRFLPRVSNLGNQRQLITCGSKVLSESFRRSWTHVTSQDSRPHPCPHKEECRDSGGPWNGTPITERTFRQQWRVQGHSFVEKCHGQGIPTRAHYQHLEKLRTHSDSDHTHYVSQKSTHRGAASPPKYKEGQGDNHKGLLTSKTADFAGGFLVGYVLNVLLWPPQVVKGEDTLPHSLSGMILQGCSHDLDGLEPPNLIPHLGARESGWGKTFPILVSQPRLETTDWKCSQTPPHWNQTVIGIHSFCVHVGRHPEHFIFTSGCFSHQHFRRT